MLRVGFSHWVGKKPGEGELQLPAVAFSTNRTRRSGCSSAEPYPPVRYLLPYPEIDTLTTTLIFST